MSDSCEGDTLHGDPLTANPRLHCTECGEYVYLTQARHTDLLIVECECAGGSLDGEFPERWERAF